ncbi:efflux RND transporter periplasmic adaptor subunit [Aerosakkonema funiforme]|nr:efflux RND transporter periplasmic adaptor subunit [Aerosakkonema funiforme]
MEIPLIGKKVDRRTPWMMGLIAATLLTASGGAYLFLNRATPKNSDITALTVPVESKNLTLRITASGTVVPFQTVNLSPKATGRVAELLVEQGDSVKQGQIVARMDDADIVAQIVQAKARWEQAKASLAKARAGNRPEEIAQAKARLAQAQAQLAAARAGARPEEIAQARSRLAQVEAQLAAARAGARPEEIAQARSRLAQAEAQLAAARAGARPEEIAQARSRLLQAQAQLTSVQTANPQQIAAAKAQVESAQARVDLAKERVNRYQNLQQQGAITRDRFDEVLTDYRTATASVEEAQRRLAQVQNGTSPAEIAQRQAAVAEARQALELLQNGTRREEIAQRQAAVAEARKALELLQNGTRLEDIAQREAAVAEARKALELLQNGTRLEDIAQREAAVAEARQALELLQNGSRPEDIAQAEASVKEAQGRLQQVQVQLEDTIVRAPFDGTITQKYANVGAFVAPATSGSSTASATSTSIVAIARGLEILAKVPEVDIGQIKQGQSVEVVADAYPDKVFKGRVRLIAPEAVIDQNVTSFQIRVALDTGLEELRSGMNVDLTFLGNEVKNTLMVPTVAIVTENGQTGVKVPGTEKKCDFRPVTIGSSQEDQTQILEGLKEGDRIFVDLPKECRPRPQA